MKTFALLLPDDFLYMNLRVPNYEGFPEWTESEPDGHRFTRYPPLGGVL